MDTRYISYIVEIADQKNMTKAAERLYVSQPSLSQYLSKLEQELGTPLFQRVKGELIPTPAGELYVACARKILDMKKELYCEIANLTNAGHINVATTSSWALSMISELIPVLKKKYPDTSIELLEGNLVPTEQLLSEKKVDIAFVAINSLKNIPGNGELLGTEEILFAVPQNHPAVKKLSSVTALSAETLSACFGGDHFILPRKDSTVNHAIQDFLALCHIDSEIVCTVNHMTTISNMVANQVGVSFIPSTCKQPHLPITYFSLQPKIFRLSAILYRDDRPLTNEEKYLMELARNYKLFQPAQTPAAGDLGNGGS